MSKANKKSYTGDAVFSEGYLWQILWMQCLSKVQIYV